MAPSSKGKEKVSGGGSDKRKRGILDDDKTGDGKRRNRGVVQFFEVDAQEAAGDDSDDDSDENFINDYDSWDDDFEAEIPSKGASRPPSLRVKEEQQTEEEFDRMMEERYKPGSKFVTFEEDNEDDYESKESMLTEEFWNSAEEPVIWKVKCVIGRERHSVFCLMQKYVDLKYLGNPLRIISAISIDHVKGFIYIEAFKQQDIYEACNGLSTIYASRTVHVRHEEVKRHFTVRSIGANIKEGMWARVKLGKYKGDLAQVAAINNASKKVTVKLVPRIDMKGLAEKIARGTTVRGFPANRAVIPAPRLISSSELEEFRPLIQHRRDRDTGKVFDVLDGMLLKDGYLYKKVSLDSLSFWGASPTEDELLKFEPSHADPFKDVEFLTQLYGEEKKKRPVVCGKVGGKGDGASSSSVDSNFEVGDLVFIGRNDFGVITGSEKDGTFKIIKPGSEGAVVAATLQQRDLKNASFDKKLFSILDQQSKIISINDTVRVTEGPLKDREGAVKRIYRGILFLHNETVEENSGYFCVRGKTCEKVEVAVEVPHEKGAEPGPSEFGDFPSSPKSPLSPKESGQGRDGIRNFKREDDSMFSVGQQLRIRVGPLKGYLCRVLAVRRTDVTVKLDSKHKVITVKCEHVVEVRGRNSGNSLGEDSGMVKPFDLLTTQDGSTDWMDGASKLADGGNWNAGGSAAERNQGEDSWGRAAGGSTNDSSNSAWNASGVSTLKPTVGWGGTGGSAGAPEDVAGGSSWGKPEAKQGGGSSWGNQDEAGPAKQEGGSSWGKQEAGSAKQDGGSSWGKQEAGSAKQDEGLSWGKPEAGSAKQDGGSSWGTAKPSGVSSWGKPEVASTKDDGGSSWGTAKPSGGSSWGKPEVASTKQVGGSSWGKPEVASTKEDGGSSWGTAKPSGGSSWGKPEVASTKQVGGSSWGKPDAGSANLDGGSSWGAAKPSGGSSWGKPEVASIKQDAGSSWGKQEAGSAMQDGGSSWGKPEVASTKEDGGSSWGTAKPSGGSSWGKPEVASTKQVGGSSWGKPDAGSAMQDGGSSWGKPEIAKQAGGVGGGWGKKETPSETDKMDIDSESAGAWNKKTTDGTSASGWGQTSKIDVGTKASGAWGKKTSDVDATSGWGQTSKVDVEVEKVGTWDKKISEGGSSSGWGKSSKGGAEGDKVGSWNNNKTSDGDSSGGWGQSKWAGASDAGGNENSWSSKGNWNSDGNFSDKDEKNESFDDRGSGGNWRGGRGGRWGQDRGGFRGRGERGVYGDRGGSGRGDFGGRDGSDRGGFRGRGSFGGRGRGRRDDWNNNDSGEEKNVSNSWNNPSDNGGGWSSNSGGGSDRGGFRGRGGFGGRGRGRRDDWNNNDSGEEKNVSNSWNNPSDNGGGWSSNSGGGSEKGGFRGGFGGRGRGRRDDWNNEERNVSNSWNNPSDNGGGWTGNSGGGYERGGFRGRGGFGGRGRGRRDDWNNRESGEENANNGGGWNSNSGGGNWSSGAGNDQGKGFGGSSGWGASEGAAAGGSKETGEENANKGGGWNTNSGGGNWGSGAGNDKGKGFGGSSGWGASEGAAAGDQWNKDSGKSDAQASGSQGWATNSSSGGGNWKDAASKEPQGGNNENAGGWGSGPSNDDKGKGGW